jgi:hypothetical protein
VVQGELGTNLPAETMQPILEHAGTHRLGLEQELFVRDLPESLQVHLDREADLMLTVQRTASGAAVHIIRYDFDPDLDQTPTLPELTLELRLPESMGLLSLHSPGDGLQGELEVADDGVHCLRLRDVPLYGIVELARAG